MKRCVLLLPLLICCSFSCAIHNYDKESYSPASVESRALTLLSAGEQSKAEELLETQARLDPSNQRLAFLVACCMRSRFAISESFPLFRTVAKMGMDTVSGQASILLLYLDSQKQPDQYFEALRYLVEKNQDDLFLRWMLAVQCRTHDRNEEGVRHYQKLLEKWNPGPVLLHQTYANLLDELGRYEEALASRRKAVKLEPKGWSYQGMGNTLARMGRLKEANEAYAKAVELSPEDSVYWSSWAYGLLQERKAAEAISKCEKALFLDAKNFDAWSYWGMSLEMLGKRKDALLKYQKSFQINPQDKIMRRIKALEEQIKWLGRTDGEVLEN